MEYRIIPDSVFIQSFISMKNIEITTVKVIIFCFVIEQQKINFKNLQREKCLGRNLKI